ncbi:MAG: hypothetical protein ABFC31_05355 [Clostridiaceae bacterium]
MKRKLYKIALVAEAFLCVLLSVFKASVSDAFLAMVAFPFEQIGIWLRVLSLSGAAGNACAFLLYAAFCLLPVGSIFFIRRKRVLLPEDGVLPVLSITLFAAIYFMINPGIIAEWFQGIPAGKAVLGGTIYSILIAYFILRILRLFRTSEIGRLQRYLVVLSGLLNVVFIYLIFGAGVKSLLDDIAALQAGNVGNEYLLGASYVFAALQYLVDVLPYGFDLLIVFAGIKLLGNLASDRYSDATVLAASRLSRLCGTALSVTVLAIASLNLLQMIFAKLLFNIHAALQVPLFSIAFVLAALLFSRLVAENKLLKEDNDSII